MKREGRGEGGVKGGGGYRNARKEAMGQEKEGEREIRSGMGEGSWRDRVYDGEWG